MSNKSADEMFEDLGYKKFEGLRDIRYCTENNLIIFYKDFKGIEKRKIELVDYFTMQELQAINKKVKELGWLDE